MRRSAFTSTSCGCGSSGSQKKMTESISPSAILAPICWSPPKGPLLSFWTRRPSSFSRSPPVVPVATSRWPARVSRLKRAHSSRSCFLLSWAMRAMVFRASKGNRFGTHVTYTSLRLGFWWAKELAFLSGCQRLRGAVAPVNVRDF